MSLGVFLLLTAVVAAAGAGLWWLGHRQTERREAFEETAARRGWSFTLTKQSLGRPAVLRFASRHGLSWTAEARSQTGPVSGGGTQIRTTEFEAADPRWPDGLLVIGPPVDPAIGGVADALLAHLDGPMMQGLIGRLVDTSGAEGALLVQLRTLPTEGGPLILASSDPARRVEIPALLRLIEEWRPRVQGDRGTPVLILGPQGLRIRLRHGISRADHMESFVDFCLRIARTL